MSLQSEFEPLLLSPHGFHRTAAICTAAWRDSSGREPQLADEIERATTWLARWTPTKCVNRKLGSSYGLKAVAEHWHQVRKPGANYYIGNGAFCMGAVRLGFPVEPTRGWSVGTVHEFSNAWLGLPRAAGDFDKVTYDSSSGRSWLDADPDLRFFAAIAGDTGYAHDFYADEREHALQDLLRCGYTVSGDFATHQEALIEVAKQLRAGHRAAVPAL